MTKFQIFPKHTDLLASKKKKKNGQPSVCRRVPSLKDWIFHGLGPWQTGQSSDIGPALYPEIYTDYTIISVSLPTVWCNQIGIVRKWTLFISLQRINNTFRRNDELFLGEIWWNFQKIREFKFVIDKISFRGETKNLFRGIPIFRQDGIV